MCGINGFNFVDKKKVTKMNQEISHRGPDAKGIYSKNGVSLGHQRLSIIDLSLKGKQPMTYSHKGKNLTIVFNGEIYNFNSLKEDLIKKGYKFSTLTDTEVLMACYLEYGFDFVNKLNGMWAFCIFDLNKKILFLSRDRFGKKPLHYYFDGKRFIFSSEIKAILKHDFIKDLDNEAIDLYFSLGFIPAPYTIYKQIKKLGASENLIFDLRRRKIEKYRYYELPDYQPIYDKILLKREVKKLLEDSTKIRLISDVPLGAFLSGGLDSSSVVYEMTKYINPNKMNTYSIGFDGKFDETPYINILKDKLHTNHHHKYFKERDFKDILDKIFDYYDEPFADPSMFPSFFLSQFTKKDLTVSLSGDGGDEVFGGYQRYRIAKQLEILRLIPKKIRKIIFNISKGRIKEGIRLSFLKKEDFYSEARLDFYKPEITKNILKDQLSFCLNKSKGNLQEAVRLMDIYFYTLPDNYLLKVDRASMASALEIRCPLLDYRLVELSMQIPSKYKCNLLTNKILFREILKKYLPKRIVFHKKSGFTPPINKWIMKEEYLTEIKRAVLILEKEKIISKEWANFYLNKIINGKDLVSNNYKIRLFLFYKWYLKWIKGRIN